MWYGLETNKMLWLFFYAFGWTPWQAAQLMSNKKEKEKQTPTLYTSYMLRQTKWLANFFDCHSTIEKKTKLSSGETDAWVWLNWRDFVVKNNENVNKTMNNNLHNMAPFLSFKFIANKMWIWFFICARVHFTAPIQRSRGKKTSMY